MDHQDAHVIVVGAGISGLLICQALKKANIRFSIFEREETLNYRSNEWTMAIHWALPLLKDILPEQLYAKMSVIACNPTVGIHSGLYPIINGETGELITGVPYENGLRVPRSRMRALAAEGIHVQYGKLVTDIAFNESGRGVVATLSDGTIVPGTMIIGADGPKSTVRQFAMGSADKAAVTKFPIFHTNMTVCYNDADKAKTVRHQYPTSYLALSQRSFHAFQSISSMPEGPDHPESWVFHMAMAWLGEVDNSLSYRDRLALIKERAAGMGEPARSAFMWLPDDTEVHKADISYWVTQAWDNRQGRLTLLGDAAHPMPPYRGQGLNHCIKDVSLLSEVLKAVLGSPAASLTLAKGVAQYEEEMIPRGAEEVRCSVENGMLLHDWKKIQESPVFRRGFKPMDGHGDAVHVAGPDENISEHARVQMERDAELAGTLAAVSS
ncbi:Aromatic-ring hydroxylase-like protein [Metarhizium album ARSEF 1941]|uniref:Aromatic-ring hydroxylase-like protein n=1 Tax=Metarhizium album (strain ARSEF 1941) TaxID=1081103 RepID=A0A0B2WMH3_METAS|nr:Aromatic-ring hydroxylase-like protein [Metarhizium album ARSEF 1941]KHN94879.1 Aromatic-ring hydroxylase-like protein [Metarhizium album ARSEF 1941]